MVTTTFDFTHLLDSSAGQTLQVCHETGSRSTAAQTPYTAVDAVHAERSTRSGEAAASSGQSAFEFNVNTIPAPPANAEDTGNSADYLAHTSAQRAASREIRDSEVPLNAVSPYNQLAWSTFR